MRRSRIRTWFAALQCLTWSRAVMYRILSVSHEPSESHWHRSLLEGSGNRVLSAKSATQAHSSIRASNVDTILLGMAVGVEDRTRLSLLGVSSNIPVVCMCGLESEPGCPVVHILPSEAPMNLSAVVAELGKHKRMLSSTNHPWTH